MYEEKSTEYYVEREFLGNISVRELLEHIIREHIENDGEESVT